MSVRCDHRLQIRFVAHTMVSVTKTRVGSTGRRQVPVWLSVNTVTYLFVMLPLLVDWVVSSWLVLDFVGLQ